MNKIDSISVVHSYYCKSESRDEIYLKTGLSVCRRRHCALWGPPFRVQSQKYPESSDTVLSVAAGGSLCTRVPCSYSGRRVDHSVIGTSGQFPKGTCGVGRWVGLI